MLDLLPKDTYPRSSVLDPHSVKFSFDMMDDVLDKPKKKGRKGKKSKKHKHTSDIDQAYAQLAFAYGFQSCKYDLLTRTVELAIAASRGKLNDHLLELNLKALRQPRYVSLPK